MADTGKVEICCYRLEMLKSIYPFVSIGYHMQDCTLWHSPEFSIQTAMMSTHDVNAYQLMLRIFTCFVAQCSFNSSMSYDFPHVYDRYFFFYPRWCLLKSFLFNVARQNGDGLRLKGETPLCTICKNSFEDFCSLKCIRNNWRAFYSFWFKNM